MMRYLLATAFLLHSLLVLSQSEQYNFSRLNTYNGLSHNQVNTVLKDTDGYVWFATVYGLNRFDGYTCKIFRKDRNDSTSINDSNILHLFPLPNRKLWLSTAVGACIYNPDTEKFDADYNKYLSSIQYISKRRISLLCLPLPDYGLLLIISADPELKKK